VVGRARDALDDLLAAVLAAPCIVCGEIADRPTSGAACERCWKTIRFITPPYCMSCGEPLPSLRALAFAADQRCVGAAGQRCARCVETPPVIDVSRTLGHYESTLRALVHGLKYEGRRSIAPRLAALLRERCGAVLAGADAVVPVPLHRRREWSRGFNQADVIARELGMPVWRPLRRTRYTASQSTLAAQERRENVRGAFGTRRGRWNGWRAARLSGARVVLVDDVCTTGATLDACAGVLKAAGAVEVRAVTVARALLGHAAGSERQARRVASSAPVISLPAGR
jgi:ComF family protein